MRKRLQAKPGNNPALAVIEGEGATLGPDPSPPDVAFTILESRDLLSWSILDPAIHTVTLEDNQDGTNQWTVRSATPVPLNPGEQPLYLRLGVAPAAP